MERYEKRILNALLDSYENSSVFRGSGQQGSQEDGRGGSRQGIRTGRRIQFTVTEETLPAYFDESSAEYEVIHEAVQQMENRGFVKTVWKKGGILHRVILETERLEEVYSHAGRTPLRSMTDEALERIAGYQREFRQAEELGKDCTHEEADVSDAPVCRRLLQSIQMRLEEGKPVKEYLNLQDMASFDRMIRALHAVETNKASCYIREFSIRLFHDSKAFEQVKGKVIKALRTFGEDLREREEKEILAEYGIYHTPDYVYLKGSAKVRLAGDLLDLDKLEQGIGLSGDDLENLGIETIPSVKRVLTIENQTTFFRWQERETLMVYLGGYHNTVRRRLLQKISDAFPEAEYRHFGDMDADGFEIYRDLKEKTGLPFAPYLMDRETLKEYGRFARPLTDGDRKRLEKMDIPEFSETIGYMLQENIKLEQESILPVIKR